MGTATERAGRRSAFLFEDALDLLADVLLPFGLAFVGFARRFHAAFLDDVDCFLLDRAFFVLGSRFGFLRCMPILIVVLTKTMSS